MKSSKTSRTNATATLFLRLLLSLLMAGHGIPLSAWASAPVQLRVISPHEGNPSTITNLQAEPDFSAPKGQGKIKLQWTAPRGAGDESIFSYIIKYATFSVTELLGDTAMWWNHPQSITLLESDTPPNFGRRSRVIPGNTEIIAITGLLPGVYYYFAAQVIDRYNRRSDWDVQFRGITTQGRAFATTPPWMPSKVTDLVGTTLDRPATVLLNWTVPPFLNEIYELIPGHIVHPGEYCIQFSTVAPPMTLNSPNQPNNWEASYRHFISTRNIRTGDLQSYILTGLSQNTTYYVHIFTRNEWPNKWSSESAPVTLIRPYISLNPVTNLMARADGSPDKNIGSYVTLSWRNPLDEPFFRGARITYSTVTHPTSPISPNEPNPIDVEPLTSGGATDFVHVRLMPRTTYYYSVWAYDTNRFFSSATHVSVYTGVDLLAPSMVSNITSFVSLDRTGTTDRFNINLGWTKPAEPLHRNIDFGGVRIYYSTATADPLHHRYMASVTDMSFSHNDLKPLTTYYYSFASFDTSGNRQPVLERAIHSVYISEKYVPPSPLVLLASVYSANREYAEGCKLRLEWRAPSETQVERIVIRLGYDDYPRDISEGEELLVRPMRPGEESSEEFKRLLSLTTHYVSLFTVSRYGIASRARKLSFYTDIPWSDNVAPFASRDIRMHGKTRFVWGPVKFDAERKAIPRWSTPDISDIYFYEIYASTSIRAGWRLMARLSPSATGHNQLPVSGDMKYYKCRAVDASGNYADSYVVDIDGNVFVMAPDKSYVMIPPGAISKTYDPQDSSIDKYLVTLNGNYAQERGSIYRSLSVDISRIGITSTTLNLEKIPNFNFGASKCRIAFSYEVYGGKAKFGAMALEQNELQNSLGVFYFDGMEWTRINTVVASDKNYVVASIRSAGTYQLRYSLTTGEFVFYDVVPKIITPNNDGLNDRALFRFANPRLDKVSLRIYDINSVLVKDIGVSAQTSDIQGERIFWDGTDKDEKTVQPGVYIYQLEVGGKVINGTIVVAR